ncbi:hypothetical protein GXM_03220 [Nostoc sphaeroides CCNUC1]|uniref:Uncharacterized protein n=1 Tax=Nostoc sphaeroides CCNUC1 TaxID=2653204 RepID=A0A5P8VZ71_9NOSO|nr:hypothetical protein GXM_03220 [Nostoc sphaeroides CCNUC1]
MLNPKVRQKTLHQNLDENRHFYFINKNTKRKFCQINQELLNIQV